MHGYAVVQWLERTTGDRLQVDEGALYPALHRMEQKGWLAPEALIYVECSAREARPELPPAWRELKAKQAGEVGYHLLARNAGGAVPE